MKSARILFAALAATALAALPAAARTYYVSTNGTSTAAGTLADPLDIATGFGKASAGSAHEVVILSGHYLLEEPLAARGGGSVVRGATGNPADVLLDAQGNFEVMRLASDILVHSVTVTNGTNQGVSGHNASGIRLGADNWRDGSSVVSNCVIAGCVNVRTGTSNSMASDSLRGGAVVLYHNSKLLDSRVCGNVNSSAANGSGGGINVHTNTAALVEGCTIEGNTVTSHGAGILVTGPDSTLVVRNSVIKDNVSSQTGAGAAIRYNTGATAPALTFENCTFSGNTAKGSYGAAIAANGGTVTVRGCNISGNTSSGGGAVRLYGTPGREAYPVLIAEDTRFENNVATSNGGAIQLENMSSATATGCGFSGNQAVCGGALTLLTASNFIADNCSFDENSASDTADTSNGGMMITGGGAIAIGTNFVNDVWGGVWISNTVFSANSSKTYGGAISNPGGFAMIGELFNCKFLDNSAVTYGGAVFLAENTVTDKPQPARGDFPPFSIRQCLFAGNSVIDRITAGISTSSSANVANGGALYFVTYQNAMIDACTIVGNSATSSSSKQGRGGAMYHKWGGTVKNTIIANNPDTKNGGNLTTDSMLNAAAYSYNCAYPADTTLFTEANNNIALDPKFVDAENGDYRLAEDSPCKGKGLNEAWMADAQDLAGLKHRIYGENVDIGAYEIFIPAAFTMVIR